MVILYEIREASSSFLDHKTTFRKIEKIHGLLALPPSLAGVADALDGQLLHGPPEDSVFPAGGLPSPTSSLLAGITTDTRQHAHADNNGWPTGIYGTSGGTCSAADFARRLQRLPCHRRILHDVVVDVSATAARELVKRCRGHVSRGQNHFIVIAEHDDGPRGYHLHVIHDCKFHSSTCRCFLLHAIRVLPRRRRPVYSAQLDCDYFINLTNYFCCGTRRYIYVEIAGREWRIAREVGGDGDFTSEQRAAWREVEVCRKEGSVSDTESGPAHAAEESASSIRRRVRVGHAALQNSSRAKEQAILEVLRQHPSCPVVSIVSTPVWQQNPGLRFLFKEDSAVKRALHVFQTELAQMSVLEIIQYNLTSSPLYCPSVPYFDVDKSVTVLQELLNMQFHNESDRITSFLTDLYLILDRRLPKCNTIEVISPPGAGKNNFFDCVCALFFNKGNVNNFNKNTGFPLQDVYNRRVLMWNEPNFCPSAMDTVKMLLGGDNLPTRVKYQDDVEVAKTPVICLSNRRVFPQDAAFLLRVRSYTWDCAPFLQLFTNFPTLWPLLNYGTCFWKTTRNTQAPM